MTAIPHSGDPLVRARDRARERRHGASRLLAAPLPVPADAGIRARSLIAAALSGRGVGLSAADAVDMVALADAELPSITARVATAVSAARGATILAHERLMAELADHAESLAREAQRLAGGTGADLMESLDYMMQVDGVLAAIEALKTGDTKPALRALESKAAIERQRAELKGRKPADFFAAA